MKRGDGEFRIRKGNEWMERANLRARRHRGLENVGAERSRGMNHRLTAVQAERSSNACERVVGHGEDDQFDFIEQRRCLGECPCSRHERLKTRASSGISGGDGAHRPASPNERCPQRRPHGSAADNAHHRRILRFGGGVRVGVIHGIV